MDGVAFHAHHFGFDQGWTFAAARSLTGFVTGVVDLASVGAVDDHAGDSIGNGAFRQVFDAELHVGGGGVSPEIVFDNQHQAKILDGGKVQAFVGYARGLSSIADVSHDRDVFALQTRPERHASEHRNQIAEG